MADNWLGPDTCGVKLAQFERMTQDMTKVGPQLAELADQLWQALNGAGVSTAPAQEIKRISAWAQEAAADLRRRNVLAHDLDRRQLTSKTGSFITLPDRYTDQVAYAEGRRLAPLLQRAADGDRKALEAVRRYHPSDITPALAKTLVETLGAEALLKLPAKYTQKLAVDHALAGETHDILALLGRSLALTTNPDRSGYAGDDFLTELIKAGRTTFPPGTRPPNGLTGYQSLSSLIAAADTRFSVRFIKVVGGDMTDYARSIPAPLPDLTGKFNLGTGGDFLIPLLNAAASSREAAQALLNHRPTGPHAPDAPPNMRLSNLEYLLRDRRDLWGQTDHGAALGKALKTAASGQDQASQDLAFAAAKLLATDARDLFGVEDRHAVIKDQQRLDALSALRPYLAQIFAAHITKINDIYQASRYTTDSGSTPVNDADLDYLLLEIARDAKSFDILLRAQIAHAKLTIDKAVAGDSDHLEAKIVSEGWTFGHLLEARNQSVWGENARLDADLKQMQGYVSLGVGFASDKAEQGLSQWVPGAGQAYKVTVGEVMNTLTAWLARRMAEKPNAAILAPQSNTEAVEKIFNQMIATSLITHRRYPIEDLAGRSFAVGEPPRIRSFDSMNGEQIEAFLRWADNKMGISKFGNEMQSSIQNGHAQTAGHYKDSDGKNVLPTFQR
ncbi:hypothetical protein ACGFNU_25550 [Spirillospora sp. NPDC048911]|uniref:hypothetical protein n=1 Tax=Spirillospora sp. NPDC048911 TaxID=3364527 RepID=UPI0037142389